MSYYHIVPGGALETRVPIPSVKVMFEDLPEGDYELIGENVEDGWVRVHARDVANPYAPRTVRAINVRYRLTIEEITP